MIDSVGKLIRKQADLMPNNIALRAPNRLALSYSELNLQVSKTMAQLRSYGIARNDRIAMVLPNGPEAATAFLSVSTAASCAPLNPSYRKAEFDFYLTDLSANAIIVQTDFESPVRDVAKSLKIPIIELEPLIDAPAGTFDLIGELGLKENGDRPAGPEHIALVLHTSGTTSRPKIVPLTHLNLCTSALNIKESLQLVPEDCCLNVMPLFHIHGLVAAILSTIVSGASVNCTPGFYAPSFFQWLDAFKPTWFTAVPTMHQAILSRAASNAKILEQIQLRFIRSCSAPLPPQVMSDLENTFRTPVIEAYGMTEASHQMTCNPLPPGDQKPGSVGIRTGVEVAIMAENDDQLLATGEIGEVVIQGKNVMDGYANNPEANASAFSNDWFRTGDQGYFDADGYLYLTSRIKEIINRGGEKISPREVDEVLLDHPAVTQAVTFAMPDPSLGEDVAAAVVVNDTRVTEKELRQFTNTRLSYFKVPRRIIILDEIPKGQTGKLQRIGLAEKLGIVAEGAQADSERVKFVAPRNPVEDALATIWLEVLDVEGIGVHDRFLDLGGDSLVASQLISRLRETLGLEINLIDFFDAPTIAEQALIVQRMILNEEQ